MTPRPFPKRSSAPPKKELVAADTIASAVKERVSPQIAAAFAGAKVSLWVSFIALGVSIFSVFYRR